MPKIFISHIHEDELAAKYLLEFLRAKLEVREEDIFLSSNQQILLGTEWLQTIGKALGSATVVIGLFSSNAISRQWVHFESGGAWFNKKKCFIPLCIGGVKPTELGKPYSIIQGADLHDWSTAHYLISTIVRALRPEMRHLPLKNYGEDDADVQKMISSLEEWKQSKIQALTA